VARTGPTNAASVGMPLLTDGALGAEASKDRSPSAGMPDMGGMGGMGGMGM